MSEQLKSRRGAAQTQQDGILATHSAEIQSAVEKEQMRKQRKDKKREELESSLSYRTCKRIKTIMDDCLVDAIIGFIPGGIGDVISGPLLLPYIYVALFKVRSIPLTLSVIYNWLLDTCLGVIPLIGNFIDIFYKGYRKSYQQIVGFVEDDRDIISEVNGNAIKLMIFILILCVIIYYLYRLTAFLWNWIVGLFA